MRLEKEAESRCCKTLQAVSDMWKGLGHGGLSNQGCFELVTLGLMIGWKETRLKANWSLSRLKVQV